MKRFLACAVAALLSITTFAATLAPIQLLSPAGSTAGQAIVSTGSGTAPAWGGVGLNGIAAIGANTVLANATGSSAAPSAFSMPLCNAVGFALGWQTASGFTCVSGFAPLASPTFTGTPAAPTAAAGTSTTQIATTAFLTQPGPIGSVTANTGAFTTLSASSTITPSQTAGIVGTTTNNNANAGSVGEFVTSTLAAPGNSMTSGTAVNVTSISLTAGDWDVWGTVAAGPAGTTTQSALQGSISLTSATHPLTPNGGAFVLQTANIPAGQPLVVPVGMMRLSLSSTTTVYLVMTSTFGVSTLTGYGVINARRVR